jgi:hypothetical protein
LNVPDGKGDQSSTLAACLGINRISPGIILIYREIIRRYGKNFAGGGSDGSDVASELTSRAARISPDAARGAQLEQAVARPGAM